MCYHAYLHIHLRSDHSHFSNAPNPNPLSSLRHITLPSHCKATKASLQFNKSTMSAYADQLREQELFSALKSQITSLSTPLYGTRSEDASKVYDVVSYSRPYDNDNVEEQPSQLSFGVAIILYTGPPASPFTSWTLISHMENQTDIITGANRLLADLRRGMGGVIGMSFHLYSS